MATNYPGGVDSFAAVVGTDPLSTTEGGRTHSQYHTDLGDAVEALETYAETQAHASATFQPLAGMAAYGPAIQVTKSGRWTSGWQGSANGVLMTADQLLLAPYPVRIAHTLDRIGIHITVPGSVGSVIRLGLYKAQTNGADFDLVADAGTIDGTQVAGDYAITISQALTPGLYLLAVASQGAPATRPTVYMSSGVGVGETQLISASTQSAAYNTPSSLTVAGVTGAFTTPITPSRYGIAPCIAVRIA